MRRGRLSNVYIQVSLLAAVGSVLAGCAKEDGGSSSPSTKPMVAYCPYLPSKTFSGDTVTVSGKAHYQYRYLGNGSVSNGTVTFRPSTGMTAGPPFSLKINGTLFSSSAMTASAAVTALVTAINGNNTIKAIVTPSSSTDKYGNTALKLSLVDSKVWPTYTELTNLVQDGGNPNPIRYAEIRVSDSSGNIVQCAETDNTGAFSFTLPKDSSTYTVDVASRASNTHNTAYVMNNPTDNTFHKISTSVTTSADNTGLWMVAPATSTLEGGAFNILDQILNAQTYLRTETANCGSTFSDCTPFTTAPLVYVYWTKGISPGQYFGISGGISFYLNGKRELYLLGGLNGDTSVTDMDHFDNSVIIHEYGHFIEDQFASPNSPGGSHNGNSIIDPRLAWGEGWANFFQAAVTGYPYYRDTKGTVDCATPDPSNCTSVSFNEPLSSQANDIPGTSGEGIFREFSVARILYSALKTVGSGGAGALFSEIWTAFNGSTGMRGVNDPFKSIARLHKIQEALTPSGSRTDWTSIRTDENQQNGILDYGNGFTLTSGACASSPVALPAAKGTEDGSFSKSNQHWNNDFYRFDHAGGAVTITLTYDKPTAIPYSDLDLYVYKEGYTFGNGSDMAAYSNKDDDRVGTTAVGSEQVSLYMAAGRYMINIMAYTGVRAVPTNYTLKINGQTVCPNPL